MFNATNFVPFIRNHGVVFLRGAYRRAIQNAPFVFSFNIADRCPIGCQCYWRAQDRVSELSDEEVVTFFRKKRQKGYLLANLVGGEPYVRPRLLQKVAGIIPLSWLMTSATTPLLRLTRTTHIVSVDGPDAETHDRVRRSPGLYERILKNLSKARASGDFPIFIHTVLNALNYRGVRKVLETWSTNGLADGVLASTLTPIKGANDEDLRLCSEDRIWIVNELLGLKLQFGNFLAMPEAQIRRLHPDHTANLTPERCETAQLVESYDAAGQRIKQCILSEKADCRECGCVVTTMSDSVNGRRFANLKDSVAFAARLATLR